MKMKTLLIVLTLFIAVMSSEKIDMGSTLEEKRNDLSEKSRVVADLIYMGQITYQNDFDRFATLPELMAYIGLRSQKDYNLVYELVDGIKIESKEWSFKATIYGWSITDSESDAVYNSPYRS